MRSKCINSTSGRKIVTGNGYSDTDFLLDLEILAVRRRRYFSPIFANFLNAHAQFQPHYYFRFKIWRHIWIKRTRFPVKTRSLPVRDTIFDDFCDDNICECAVDALILLPVTNLSRKWIQRPRFPTTRGHFACKPTFKCTLSKLVKNLKLITRVNHFRLHHRRHLFFRLSKWIFVTNLVKIGRNESAVVDTSLKVS